VETQVELDAMEAMGCDTFQGYLLGRPKSAAHTEDHYLGRCLNDGTAGDDLPGPVSTEDRVDDQACPMAVDAVGMGR
jgi:predicted signal transduction protein with EAL and GGDEF domain